MRWFTWFVAFGIVWRGSIDLRNFRLLRLFFQGLFAFVFIRKLWCSLYIQLRWYPFALQRSHWRCLGFLLAVAKRGWSKNGSSYQQRLRGGRVEQHQWLNSSTANSCKDSSSDVAFEATDQTLHGTRPIARLKNCSTSQILSYSYQSYHAVRLHRWLLWLPKHRNNLAPMPHAGSKSTPQSVFETSFIILPWLRMGNTFIPLKVIKVCWMVPGRSVILRDQHLASRVDDCHCRRRPWMKVRKSQMHKDGFSTSFNSSEFLWFWKWSSQCCTSTWSPWLDMLDMWRSFVGPPGLIQWTRMSLRSGRCERKRGKRGIDAMGMSATKYGPITCYNLRQPCDKIDKMSGFYCYEL